MAAMARATASPAIASCVGNDTGAANTPEFGSICLLGVGVETVFLLSSGSDLGVAVRVLCFLLSFLMHVGVVVFGVSVAVQFPMRYAVGDPVYEVRLVRLQEEPPPAPPRPQNRHRRW